MTTEQKAIAWDKLQEVLHNMITEGKSHTECMAMLACIRMVETTVIALSL